MAATITGIVFNDLNHNGQYDSGEPGIPNVYVVLYSSASGCVTTQTNASGNYSFTVTAPGSYTVYEPVSSPNGCPPTEFTQPEGFTMSNGPRKRTETITAAQINNGTVIANQNFSHDTVNTPLACNTSMIQFVGRPTSWYNINIVTGQPTLQGPLSPAHDVNAIGYNVLDNYIYGYDQTTNNIVRVADDGTVIQLGRPTGLPADGYNTGTFGVNGFLYIFVNNETRFYTIDLRPNSSTFMKLGNPAAGYTEQTSNYGTALSVAANISDWVLSEGNLYGVERNGVLVRIVPTTGQVTELATTAPNPNASFGALAIDSTGTIYAIANSDGTIYKYTYSGNTATGVPFSKTFFDSFNDGTMCPTAAVRVDYGDAPDTSSSTGPNDYNTLLANNGPRHELTNRLTLGTQVPSEADAYQNPTATGDDLIHGIQDDGLSLPLPPLSVSGTDYSLTVAVVNDTGLTAHLYGWVDFDQNGLFEVNEAAPVVDIPSGAGTQYAVLNFTRPAGGGSALGSTFVRLRLTTDILPETPGIQDSRSVGPASDGEVEDYILDVGSVADIGVDKTADRQEITAGDPIIYTIKVFNNGPAPAADVLLTDFIPPEITNPQYSLDNGNTWFPWNGTLPLGTLQPGDSIPVLITGVYDGTGSGAVINTAEISTSSTDPDPDNDSSTVVTPILLSADLEVVKSASPSPVTAGQELTYTVRIFNHGPNDAEDVTLADVVSSPLFNPEFSTDGGATWQPWNSPYPLGHLPAGADLTILIRGTVDPSATGDIHNAVTILSSTPDPDPNNNTDTVITPIESQADISIVKLGSPKPVHSGELLTYTLIVSNAGPSSAADVIVTDMVPPSLSNVEFSTDNGISFQPWNGSYLLGELAPGTAQTILIRGLVDPSATGSIVNTATVDSPTPDPDPGNNTSTDDTPVETSADLTVTKLGAPKSVPAGDLLTYTITVHNLGPSDAQDVLLTDNIPPELTDAEYSTNGGTTWLSWSGSANLGAFAGGELRTILIRGRVDNTATGIITNTAVVSSPTPDPDPGNNQDTDITPINTSADLGVIKAGSPNPVDPNQTLTYSVTVTNYGPNPASNVVLTDPVPAELLNPEYSINGGNTWFPWSGTHPITALAPSASQTIQIRGTVSAAAAGKISNTASVTSDTPDPDPDNNTDTEIIAISESADLSVIKAFFPNPVRAGEILSYTITVSNQGPSAAQNVRLNDVIPAEIINPEFAVQGSPDFAPWVSPYAIGTLQSGAQATITIRGLVSPATIPGSRISNTASVTSDTPDPNPDNNTDTVQTSVITSADVAVRKEADTTPAVPGQAFRYTITVTNAGPSNAQDVVLVDAVPVSLMNAEFSINGGLTYAPWNSPYMLGVLSAGESRNILIRGMLSPSATGQIANTTVVNSPTPDPDPDNNTSTDITPIEPSADISVVKTVSPSPVPAGGQITYTLLVSNSGPSEAENTVLNDPLPAGISNSEISADGGQTWIPYTGTYTVGNLVNEGFKTLLIRARVLPSAIGELTNISTVTSDTPDPNPDNNTSTATVPVVPSADLSVTKTSDPDPVPPGGILTYTITVSNAGPADALNVTLRDNLPSSLSNAEFSTDGGISWQPWNTPYQLATLPANDNRIILIRGTVISSVTGTILNTAVVTSDTPDPDPSNNSDTNQTDISTSGDIEVRKTVQPTSAVPGGLLTYTITITNNGPDQAENVILYDSVPPELSEAQFSIDGGTTWAPWSNPYTLGLLAGGESRTVLIRGTVTEPACGTIANTATAISNTPDPNPENNTDTVIVPVTKGADLSVVKTACNQTAVPCQYLVYRLTVTNSGPETAQQATIFDRLPSELTYAVFSVDGGRTWRAWSGSYQLGTLGAGKTVSILLAGIVSPCARGTVKNTATVSSATSDPDPDNNTSTAAVEVQRHCSCALPPQQPPHYPSATWRCQ